MAIYSTKQLVRTKRICRFAPVQCALLSAAMSVVMLRVTHAQQAPTSTGQTFYSHGDPTNEEQYLLQKLNRARMDPVGEGQRLANWLTGTSEGQGVMAYYGTDPAMVAADLAALPAVPPLAFDAKLIAAARSHSDDLAPHDGVGPGAESDVLRDHNGYNGSTPMSRVAAAGYTGYTGTVGGGYGGENYGPGSDTLDADHAGFLVDWGNLGFGHRKNAYSIGAGEVGIGLATKPASLGSAFPLVMTEDFGWLGFVVSSIRLGGDAGTPALLTGVVYRDANGNGQYDVGEGVSGVRVTMDGGFYYTITSASGGYALPLALADGTNASGAVTVRMDGLPGDSVSTTVVMVGDVKVSSNLSSKANVEWDVVVGQGTATGPELATISGGGVVNAGSNIKLTVARAAGSDAALPLTVTYKAKGTAVAGVDYKALPGTVIIPAGAPSAKVKVKTVVGGGNTRTLTIKLKSVSGAQSKATVTFMP